MRNMLTDSQLDHAYVCALLSVIAYDKDCEEERIELRRRGYVIDNTYDIDGTQFITAVRRNHLIIAFRGTDGSVEDLVTIYRAQHLIKTDFGRVGHGFIEYAEKSWDIIKSLLQRHNGHVTITGHSLGGAATVYTAIKFKESVDDIVTFGCPRVGDHLFAFNTNRYFPYPKQQRWVNANDIVTKVPFQFGRFQHSNALQYISTSGDISTSPGMIYVAFNRYGWIKRSVFKWATDQFADHSMQNKYAPAIKDKL